MSFFDEKFSTPRRIVIVGILIGILIYSFTGEKLPYNNGLGWDGEDYFSILQNFSDSYLSHGINAYHIQRILPFAILHYTYSLFGIEVTPQSAVAGCSVLNFLCILLTVLYFFKISKNRKWNPTTETIAFAICFFNVPILKVFGYYALLTDCPAYLLSYMAIYYFLTNNRIMEAIVGLMAMITWPFLALVIWMLAFFPRDEVQQLDSDDRSSKLLSYLVRIAYTMWLPVLFVAVSLVMHSAHPERPFVEWFNHRHPLCFLHACICIITTAVLFFFASKAFKLNWNIVLTTIFKKRNFLLIVASFVVFVCVYKASTFFGGKSTFSPIGQIVALQEYPATDIFVILETHFIYLGLFFLMIILLWKDFVQEVCRKYGIGLLLVVMLGLIFITEIETRKLISFYPVFLIPLMGLIDKKSFKNWVPFAFVVISLILSFFWWKINVPGIMESFIARIDNYRAFPAQRYFMFMGPWQCRMVYMITLAVEVVMGAVIIYLNKKNLIYKTQE